MSYGLGVGGRVDPDGSGDGRFLSFGDVEDRLIEAVRLCWRSEGGGWPFAGDGPWHLIRKEWWDWDARDAARLPRLPLSRAEMARRDEAIGWLAMVPRDGDRRLIVLAVTALARGGDRARVPWRRLLAPMGLTRGADGLRMRYGRALAALCRRING